MRPVDLKVLSLFCVIVAMAAMIAGCGGGGGGGVPVGSSGGTSTGKVTVSLTDAPTTGMDHVWVTVKEIRFHRSELCDDPADGGWLRYPLATPVTLDLASLDNGTWSTLWDGITLPVGSYQQIRLVLAGTEDPLLPSARARGLLYNNQADDNGLPHPLVVPAARNGIKLIGSFMVTSTATLHIVVDFDVAHDVVETGSGKYILKPRLKYFIVAIPQTSAIIGTLVRPDGTAFANYTGVNVVIKAEAPQTMVFANSSSVRVMGITRATKARPDGSFILYPLPSSPGKTYDLVVRGAGIRTMILRDVPAEPGTVRDAPSMFTIGLRNGMDYLVSAQAVNARTSPYEPALGSSVGFYQTLPGTGEIPYLIRVRDVSPFYGTFGNFPLAFGDLLVGRYNPKTLLQSFTGVVPLEGPDSYAAFATAPFFWPSGPQFYSPANTFNRFLLTPQALPAPPDCDMDDDHESVLHPDKGYYVACGGLVVDHIRRIDLEGGGYEFQSVDTNGRDLRSHGKTDKVNMNNRRPVRIKFMK